MILEHHITQKSNISEWMCNHPDKEVFKKFNQYRRILEEQNKEFIHDRNSIENTKDFIEYNIKNNEYYSNGIDLVLINNLPDKIIDYFRGLPVRQYFKKRDELLDVYYNTYLNRINRDQKINKILE